MRIFRTAPKETFLLAREQNPCRAPALFPRPPFINTVLENLWASEGERDLQRINFLRYVFSSSCEVSQNGDRPDSRFAEASIKILRRFHLLPPK